MTNDPRPEPSSDARRAAPTAARRRCPRCGAALGVLAAGGASGETRNSPEGPEPGPAADALYCGCCGLVVPAA